MFENFLISYSIYKRGISSYDNMKAIAKLSAAVVPVALCLLCALASLATSSAPRAGADSHAIIEVENSPKELILVETASVLSLVPGIPPSEKVPCLFLDSSSI